MTHEYEMEEATEVIYIHGEGDTPEQLSAVFEKVVDEYRKMYETSGEHCELQGWWMEGNGSRVVIEMLCPPNETQKIRQDTQRYRDLQQLAKLKAKYE